MYTASPESQKQTPEHMLHFTQAVFRAVETRTPVVRAVNTGISGWVDPGGNVRKMMKNPAAAGRKNTIAPFRAVFHVAPGGTTTLYLRWGEWFALAVTGGCLLLALIPVLLSRNSRN
ncbi:MAG: hypothetical protein HN909_04830 [Phycisphaerales bacterium]|nr:hypothetical protein [Phycisphaerales bacterium]